MSPLRKLVKFMFSKPVESPKENWSEVKAAASYNKHYLTDNYSGGAKYPGGISGDGRSQYFNHYALRQNARTACFDVPQAKALVDRFADTTVDIGLMLEATPKASIIGISPEKAEEWSRDVQERFDTWANDKRSHRSEINNFYQNQRLYGISQHRDNDIFVRFFYSKNKDLQNPLQVEFIDPDQINGFGSSSTNGICNMVSTDGIERDERNREVAYHVITKKKQGDNYKLDTIRIPAKGAKSKKTLMIHGFTQEYAGQGRGISRLAHALQEFQNLTDFSLAQIKKAINQSMITMYVKPSKDAPASNPFDGIITGGAGPGEDEFQIQSTPTETETGCEVTYKDIPEARNKVPGSTGVFNLEGGEDLAAFDGKAPSESFDNFVTSFVGFLTSSAGMPVEVMLMKFNQNYSASRAALILFWRVAQIWRKEMAADFLNPVYEMWLSGEIATGRIQAPGWSNPIVKQAWLSNNWIGAPMPNIDPMRTAKADMLYAQLGAQDLDRIARNHNGSDGKANRAKLKRQVNELTPLSI